MLDQLANYLQALWAYVLREPLKVGCVKKTPIIARIAET